MQKTVVSSFAPWAVESRSQSYSVLTFSSAYGWEIQWLDCQTTSSEIVSAFDEIYCHIGLSCYLLQLSSFAAVMGSDCVGMR